MIEFEVKTIIGFICISILRYFPKYFKCDI